MEKTPEKRYTAAEMRALLQTIAQNPQKEIHSKN